MDLSKIKVRGEEIKKCEDRYYKAKIVHTILKRVAIANDVDLIDLYSGFVWPLYNKKNDLYTIF